MSPSHVLWLFALLFTPAGAVVGGVACRNALQARRLLRHGTIAQGTVTRLERTQIAPGSDNNGTTRTFGTTVYYPVVAWATADGRIMESRARIARPAGKVRPVGARIDIRYDPADPTHWTLPADGSAFWWLFVAMGALFSMVGLGFLLGALSYGA
ncbi:DUF3592 domain-containing protein (plasmid) [Streptomyces sp. NBC_01298]|uniref:DUF3592 domain-containing protein n=1 Tax=Streptomyces sp. NBC_01298 TaxID=2903817 RepID=UPI002E12AD7E|nr:DUF3592 domain-containing protein [Streptomyces sp. NBC_01298]